MYVVFVSSNIKSISDYFTDEPTDVRLFMLIILLPLILINWVCIHEYMVGWVNKIEITKIFFSGSKSKILSTIFNNRKFNNLGFVWDHLLLYFS